MSLGAKILLLIVVTPVAVALLWAVLRGSIVHIPISRLGLLVVRGRPTDRVLLPGPHWVPALRKRQAVEYPAIELSYRASFQPQAVESSAETYGPALSVTLGDRVEARVEYTVRFRLDPARLRSVHERFGPDGIWAVVRDESARAITLELAKPACTVGSVFGRARGELQDQVGTAVARALNDIGIVMTRFSLGSVDLGRTGQTIQAVARAQLELEREEAEAATRAARVHNDSELAPQMTSVGEMALRYRQTDMWRDFLARPETMQFAVPAPGAQTAPPAPAVPGAVPAMPHDSEVAGTTEAPVDGGSVA